MQGLLPALFALIVVLILVTVFRVFKLFLHQLIYTWEDEYIVVVTAIGCSISVTNLVLAHSDRLNQKFRIARQYCMYRSS